MILKYKILHKNANIQIYIYLNYLYKNKTKSIICGFLLFNLKQITKYIKQILNKHLRIIF